MQCLGNVRRQRVREHHALGGADAHQQEGVGERWCTGRLGEVGRPHSQEQQAGKGEAFNNLFVSYIHWSGVTIHECGNML
jgi:hypothetical protein